MKWEYTFFEIDLRTGRYLDFSNEKPWERNWRSLNVLGEQGWEMVSFALTHINVSHAYAIFKRIKA